LLSAAAALKPLGWTRFLQHLPPEERGDPLLGYYKRLLSPHANTRAEAVSAFNISVLVGLVSGGGLYLAVVGWLRARVVYAGFTRVLSYVWSGGTMSLCCC